MRAWLLGAAVLGAFVAGWATAPRIQAPHALPVPAPPSPRPPPPPPPEPGCDELRAELLAQRQQNDELDDELHGLPLSWPDEQTRERSERAYRQAMDEVLAQCLPDWTLAGLDCEEVPCVAVLRAPRGTGLIEDLSACEPWTRRYTGLSQSDHGWRVCGEDLSDVGLLAVGNSVQLAHPDVIEGEDVTRFDNELKRTQARFERLIAKETECP